MLNWKKEAPAVAMLQIYLSFTMLSAISPQEIIWLICRFLKLSEYEIGSLLSFYLISDLFDIFCPFNLTLEWREVFNSFMTEIPII